MTEWLGLPPLATAHGSAIDSLIGWTHIFMFVLFIGWGAFFAYVLLRFRKSRNPQANYHGMKSHATSYIEGAVLVVELVLLFAFSIPLWAQRVDHVPSESEALVVHVTAEQFAWNVRYPGADNKFGKTDIKLIDTQSNPLGVDHLDVGLAELPVMPRVADVPRELLGGHVHDQGLAFRRDVIDSGGPERDREGEEQHELDDEDGAFEIAGGMRLDAVVVGDRMARLAEPEQDVGEERAPPDEQDEHEDVRPADQVVDCTAVRRCQRRESEPLSHDRETFWSFDHSLSRSASAICFARLRR